METPQQQTNLNFGQALDLLKQGFRLQRAGWNGKGMCIFLRHPPKTKIEGIDPYLCMCTAAGTLQPRWLESQADMLAEDWQTCYTDPEPAV